MKKSYFMMFTLFCITMSTNAQMMQGDVSIDPYIGVPNWANAILFKEYDGSATQVSNYKVMGGALSYGGRVEYMASEKVGVGADVNYEVSGYSYSFQDYAYDASGNPLVDGSNNYIYTNYDREYTSKKLRAMFRLNYHFVKEGKIDMYTGFAAGYKSTKRETVTSPTNPSFIDANMTKALIPVTARIAVGAKMYFTNNIGAHIELGLGGGGLLQFGISAKF
jgi:hypothetical protein